MNKNDRLDLIEIAIIIIIIIIIITIIIIIIIVVVVWSSPLHLFALAQYSAPGKPYSNQKKLFRLP